MDVFGGSKNGYYGGLTRRRLRIDTPEINTYQRQILFCEKKFDKINQKFRIPVIRQAGTSSIRNSQKPFPAECWSSNSAVVPYSGSRKNSIDNFYAGMQRRKSSQQYYNSRKRQSITLSQKFPSSHFQERCSSESKAATTRDPSSFDNKQHRHYSRRESDLLVTRGNEREKHARENNKKHVHDIENSKADAASTPAALDELNFVLRRERDQLLRALTTLAINRITTDKSDLPQVERNTTFTHYERNIDVLADSSRLTLHENVAPYLAHDNQNKDVSSASGSSSDSDIYGPIEGENIVSNPDKRERINRLRNYLKCSGFGNPNMIRTTTEQSEDEKRAFSRLIKRINRGLSFEKQDRLRRKARLDYEMSLMKGESFCEQQEQAYMRTASADMENRDLQLLEDELRIHALREIRHNKKENLKKQNTISRQQSHPCDLLNESYGRHISKNDIIGGEMGATHVEDGDGIQVADEKSSSDDRDAMSGLIRNPLSRKEMRKRILLWVYDVEEATGPSKTEGERLEKKLFRNDRNHYKDRIAQENNSKSETLATNATVYYKQSPANDNSGPPKL